MTATPLDPGAADGPTPDLPPEPPTGPTEWDSPYDPEDDELELPAHRRRVGLLTMVLSLLLVAGLGVYGGVRLQKSRSSSSSGTTASALASALASRFGGTGTRGAGAGATGARGAGAFAGFGGGTGGSGAGGLGGGSTVGTVKLVDGNTIYLSQTDGSIVKVTTTPTGTTVTKTVPSSVSALQPGETLVVQGSTGSDGTVTATRVTDAGATALGGGGGTGGGSGN